MSTNLQSFFRIPSRHLYFLQAVGQIPFKIELKADPF
jgi:hypothetical protein